MKKILLGMLSLGIVISFQTKGIVSEASDTELSLTEAVLKQESTEDSSTEYLEMSTKLAETEDRLLNSIKINYNKTDIDVNSDFYLNLLNEISISSDIILSDDELEQAEFSEFATIYINRIASLIPINITDKNLSEIEKERNILLNRTYQDIKNENLELISNLKVNPSVNSRALRSSGSFSVSTANWYASKYAINSNPNFTTFRAGDCTNFASQIANAAGKQQSYYQNAGNLTWYYTNSFAYSKTWSLAHQFVNYWTAEGAQTIQCTTKSAVKSSSREGDFIAYWKKGTYEIGHISYINAKRGNNVYVSQHSTNRYNYSFDSQDTSPYSFFILVRIR